MAFITRLLLLALAFNFVLPSIGGIDVNGGFAVSIGLALLFSILGVVVSWLAAAATAVLTVGTLGLALLVLIPLWVFGFWLLPAYVLMLTSEVMPSYLTVSGWAPAIMGGLITLFIGVLTDAGVEERLPA